MRARKCPNCGANVKSDICEYCGAEFVRTGPDKIVTLSVEVAEAPPGQGETTARQLAWQLRRLARCT